MLRVADAAAGPTHGTTGSSLAGRPVPRPGVAGSSGEAASLGSNRESRLPAASVPGGTNRRSCWVGAVVPKPGSVVIGSTWAAGAETAGPAGSATPDPWRVSGSVADDGGPRVARDPTAAGDVEGDGDQRLSGVGDAGSDGDEVRRAAGADVDSRAAGCSVGADPVGADPDGAEPDLVGDSAGVDAAATGGFDPGVVDQDVVGRAAGNGAETASAEAGLVDPGACVPGDRRITAAGLGSDRAAGVGAEDAPTGPAGGRAGGVGWVTVGRVCARTAGALALPPGAVAVVGGTVDRAARAGPAG